MISRCRGISRLNVLLVGSLAALPAISHEGHGLDAVPHDLLHVGWLLLVPFVIFAWKKRRAHQSRNRKP